MTTSCIASTVSAFDTETSSVESTANIQPRYNDTHVVYISSADTWTKVCSNGPLLGENIYAQIISVDKNCTADEFEMMVSTSWGGDQEPVNCPIYKWKTIGGINAFFGQNKWTLYIRANGTGTVTINVKDDTEYNG